MKKATNHKILFAIAFAFVLMMPFLVRAATLSVVADHASVGINQPVHVAVLLDTQGENANAIQGRILFPSRLFILQSVADGSSPVSFWINPPKEIALGVIAFAGIMPGGFTGAGRPVVSLVLMPIASGVGAVSIADVSLLRNDGKGSAISVTATSKSIAVSSVKAAPSPFATTSTIVPELFTPIISRDPNVYDGKYFLAFSTTDKGSGIDHYDVAEIPAGFALNSSSLWRTAESPYLLQDQTLSSDIYVRAVNRAGNSIVVELPAVRAYHLIIIIVIAGSALLLVLLALLLWQWRRRGRRNRF